MVSLAAPTRQFLRGVWEDLFLAGGGHEGEEFDLWQRNYLEAAGSRELLRTLTCLCSCSLWSSHVVMVKSRSYIFKLSCMFYSIGRNRVWEDAEILLQMFGEFWPKVMVIRQSVAETATVSFPYYRPTASSLQSIHSVRIMLDLA